MTATPTPPPYAAAEAVEVVAAAAAAAPDGMLHRNPSQPAEQVHVLGAVQLP